MTASADGNGAAPASDPAAGLRAEMVKTGVDAYIIPTEDPHMSEYPPASDGRREFISGFTGSAGTAVVTANTALLWTDGRYFLQAEKQLGSGWQLMRAGTPGCPDIPDWLAANLPEGASVGIDPFCHTVTGARQLKAKMEETGKKLMPLLSGNLVDRVWSSKPPAPAAPVRVHAIEHAGLSAADKLANLRKDLTEAGAAALLVTALDEVAWLLNLRGGDISYNPVFVSYVLVSADSATLYVDSAKVGPEVAAHLEEAAVDVKPYEAMLGDVKAASAAGAKLWIDPSKVSFAIATAATEAATAGPRGKGGGKKRKSADTAPPGGAKATFVEKPSPITGAKAVKNGAELAGMVEAHLRDSVALAATWHWLEQQVAAGSTVTEVDVDEFLTGERRKQAGFIEPSFPTIAGAGPNGAVIHYGAEAKTARTLDADTLLLVDSGGQYDCGTTDVTRTMHMGTPSRHQQLCFTRVLQGHIALDTAVFPEGTPGLALDVLARAPLWGMGLNYRHGTGHGVGAALNVHEGPHSISTRYYITYPLAAGMVVSNEPGYYEDGSFGIRIENLLTVREAKTEFNYGGQTYYAFDRLTLSPIQAKMIATEVLSAREVEWVDAYHQEVWEAVSPRLQGGARAPVLAWLRENTQPLKVARPASAATIAA